MLREAQSNSLYLEVLKAGKYRSILEILNPSVVTAHAEFPNVFLLLCNRWDKSWQILPRLSPVCFFPEHWISTTEKQAWHSLLRELTELNPAATEHAVNRVSAAFAVPHREKLQHPCSSDMETQTNFIHLQVQKAGKTNLWVCFLPLANLRQGSYHPAETCHAKTNTLRQQDMCCRPLFFCELIWQNNRGSHQNSFSPLSKWSFPTDPRSIVHATFSWYCRVLPLLIPLR